MGRRKLPPSVPGCRIGGTGRTGPFGFALNTGDPRRKIQDETSRRRALDQIDRLQAMADEVAALLASD